MNRVVFYMLISFAALSFFSCVGLSPKPVELPKPVEAEKSVEAEKPAETVVKKPELPVYIMGKGRVSADKMAFFLFFHTYIWFTDAWRLTENEIFLKKVAQGSKVFS